MKTLTVAASFPEIIATNPIRGIVGPPPLRCRRSAKSISVRRHSQPQPQEASLESYRASTATLLVLAAVFATVPATAKAQAADQRTLLSAFCDPSDVEGSTCKKAKDYPGGRACDVKLGEERYSGKFLAADSTLLIVGYDSGCEPHASDSGGSVVFEQSGGATAFRGYQPGYRVNECVSIAGTKAGTAWSA